ncbi:hypothetical protein GCM10017600_41830 [Streptosporangium carneum]|uniref:Uncharacterized protein n=1 Tax=Streptosporangium carneum TaxID=47481 RepID=A0A9W6I324_9ACTN|nr:hypothetical protein GCM10017600_41830 [Streptosporangium carneum]
MLKMLTRPITAWKPPTTIIVRPANITQPIQAVGSGSAGRSGADAACAVGPGAGGVGVRGDP